MCSAMTETFLSKPINAQIKEGNTLTWAQIVINSVNNNQKSAMSTKKSKIQSELTNCSTQKSTEEEGEIEEKTEIGYLDSNFEQPRTQLLSSKSVVGTRDNLQVRREEFPATILHSHRHSREARNHLAAASPASCDPRLRRDPVKLRVLGSLPPEKDDRKGSKGYGSKGSKTLDARGTVCAGDEPTEKEMGRGGVREVIEST